MSLNTASTHTHTHMHIVGPYPYHGKNLNKTPQNIKNHRISLKKIHRATTEQRCPENHYCSAPFRFLFPSSLFFLKFSVTTTTTTTTTTTIERDGDTRMSNNRATWKVFPRYYCCRANLSLFDRIFNLFFLLQKFVCHHRCYWCSGSYIFVILIYALPMKRVAFSFGFFQVPVTKAETSWLE